MEDRPRCETHGVVLTAAGACLLCARRAPTTSGRAMAWLLACVVGASLLSAVGFRIYRALSDRDSAERAMRSEPIVTAPATPAAPLPGPVTTRAMATAEAPELPPAEPRSDPAEGEREHERRVAEAQRSVRIDFYGAGWCPSCRKARAWLDAERIEYTYRDVGDSVNKHTMRALNAASTIPTIDIEGHVIVGFDAEEMRVSIRRAAEARVANAARGARR